ERRQAGKPFTERVEPADHRLATSRRRLDRRHRPRGQPLGEPGERLAKREEGPGAALHPGEQVSGLRIREPRLLRDDSAELPSGAVVGRGERADPGWLPARQYLEGLRRVAEGTILQTGATEGALGQGWPGESRLPARKARPEGRRRLRDRG